MEVLTACLIIDHFAILLGTTAALASTSLKVPTSYHLQMFGGGSPFGGGGGGGMEDLFGGVGGGMGGGGRGSSFSGGFPGEHQA